MPSESILLDGVRFYDCFNERNITVEGSRQITDVAMIPSRGDYVKFGYSGEEFIVLDRRFHFVLGGVVNVVVNVQPSGRDSQGHEPNVGTSTP